MNWVILLSPFFAAVTIALVLHPFKKASVALSIAACLVSFIATLLLIFAPGTLPVMTWSWMEFDGLTISMGAMNDSLAHAMLLVVTGVGLCIHFFAYGYMKEDPGLSRFFAKLSLFMFSMLGIVLASNLVMMFIFWELVGLSSYLLIGFWFNRPSAAEAAKKAFIVNRVGDFGFLLGILGVWWLWGSIDIEVLQRTVAAIGMPFGVAETAVSLVAFGLFMGCMGKSAQLPLHVWLPDAMEGPTPVSALIHAATMVAAGVYMLCRVFFILELAPMTLTIIAWVGIITALMAALTATQQNDIKKILAYSTLSQLGYMVAAVGLGATVAAMFHLTTHAFFKALLFLGAGSVIHSLHHEQDVWKMGGLLKKMPITAWTFLIGTLALIGTPFLSGFYSKEEILFAGYHKDPLMFGLLVFTAGLTAFYMVRLFLIAFLGKERSDAVATAHESPLVMVVPLIVLAILSVIGGWGQMIPHFIDATFDPDHSGKGFVMGASIGVLILGVVGAFLLYHKRDKDPVSIPFFAHKFYFDELYENSILKLQQVWAKSLDWMDQWLIGGILVRGLAAVGTLGGEILRLIQGGNLHAYVTVFIMGVLFVCYWVLFRPFL